MSRPTRLRRYVSAAVLALVPITTVAPAALAAPTAPSGLTATSVLGANRLTWTDTSVAETGFAVDRCYADACTAFGQIAVLPANTTTYDDIFTTGGGVASYRVRSLDATGTSAPSNTAGVFTFGTGTVEANIVASTTGGLRPVTVTVDGSGSTASLGPITDWTWSFGDGGVATGVTATHTYRTPGTYAVSLKATATVGGFGTPSASTQVLVTVTAPVPLTAATNLVAVSRLKGQADLTWTAPTGATSIDIQRCRGVGCTDFATVGTADPTLTAFANFGLTSKTVYRYRIVARNGARSKTSTVARVKVL